MRAAEPWPRDPRLDPFRDAVWELSRGGRVAGYLTCRVVPSRALPLFWERAESVWYRVAWPEGRWERPREDHGPHWPVVGDLERGRFALEDIAGTVFDARPVTGAVRDALWHKYGRPA